jgi:hypothetical protein
MLCNPRIRVGKSRRRPLTIGRLFDCQVRYNESVETTVNQVLAEKKIYNEPTKRKRGVNERRYARTQIASLR